MHELLRRESLDHLEVRTGGRDVELFSNALPAECLIEVSRRRARIAPELLGVILLLQNLLGQIEHAHADASAAQIFAHRHSTKLPGGLIIPRPSDEGRAADVL